MDKTQQKVVDFMLVNSYTDVIHRSITGFLSLAIAEIYDTMKIDKKFMARYLEGVDHSLHGNIIMHIKKQCFNALMDRLDTKKNLLMTLNDTVKKKGDIIWQIMREFEIDKSSDTNYIFDQMSNIFDTCIRRIRTGIQQSNWKEIYQKWNDV